MFESISQYFSTSNYPPRWECGSWSPLQGWIHIISDIGTFAAYTAIPCVLAYFVLRRKDIPFPRIIWLFVAFIFACGIGHLLEAIIFWWPIYPFSGLVKLTTAIVSWATVIALIPITPLALSMRSPRELEEEIAIRKRAEERLKTQSIALETSMDGIAIFEEGDRCVYANPAFASVFGYPSPDEVVGLTWKDFHPEGEVDPLSVVVAQGKQGRWRGEVRGRCQAGKSFPAEVSLSQLSDAGFVVVTRDITDRKLAESRLHELNENLERRIADQTHKLLEHTRLLQCILDSMGDGVVVADSCGKIIQLNPAGARILLTKQDESAATFDLQPDCYGRAHFDASDVSNPLPFERLPLMRSLHGETFDAAQVMIAHEDYPEGMWLSVNSRPLIGIDGTVQGGVCVYHDVTEQRQARERLNFYARQLEKSNQELSRSNRELDDFAYIASHDLKEPLRGMHNYARFLIEDHSDALNAEGQRKLGVISKLAKRMESLIESLLHYSRVGRVDMAVQQSDLNQVLDEVLEAHRINLDEKKMAVRIPDKLPSIRCDRVRIVEVFRNLLTNAMKYNDSTQPWIEISAREHQSRYGDSGEVTGVTLYFRDNGIGIDPRHHDSIFRMFRRLHGREEHGGGTGAGLAIVKKIVELHEGRISVESEEGQGTTFLIWLPQVAAVPSREKCES